MTDIMRPESLRTDEMETEKNTESFILWMMNDRQVKIGVNSMFIFINMNFAFSVTKRLYG